VVSREQTTREQRSRSGERVQGFEICGGVLVLVAAACTAGAASGPHPGAAHRVSSPAPAEHAPAPEAAPRAAGSAARGAATGTAAGSATNRDPHGPADVGEHIRWLESAERLAFQAPGEVLASLGLAPDAVVADVGCGPGVFTRPLARALPRGLVYAVDIEPQQLYRLQEHVRAEALHNVVPVLASLDDPHLPPGRLDLILIVDTYHHFEDRHRYLTTLARALKPGGRLVVIDYHKHPLPVGPPVAHKIAREVVLEEVLAAGYRLVEERSLLRYQYFLVFERATTDGGAGRAPVHPPSRPARGAVPGTAAAHADLASSPAPRGVRYASGRPHRCWVAAHSPLGLRWPRGEESKM
jgi:ubiquinone/menaquinone biosynthesis C-methylase UbiE